MRAVVVAVAVLGASSPSLGDARGQGALEGSVEVVGSDTLLELNEAWARAFAERHEQVEIVVRGGGSRHGIAALIQGEADLAAASRRMTARERELFVARHGVPPEAVAVAIDGVAFYVHDSNPVTYLSMAELAAILRGEITNWEEVGGRNRKILVFIRNEQSGTHAYVRKAVLGGAPYRNDAHRIATTSGLMEAVSRHQGGIGYGGVAYVRGGRILRLTTRKADEALWPSHDEVVSGRYPLSRPLFFYALPAREAGTAGAFVRWVLSEEGQDIVEDVGYYRVADVESLDDLDGRANR